MTSQAGHGSRIFSVKYHPTDEHIVVSGGWDRIVVVWDVRVSEPLRYFSGVFICGQWSKIALGNQESARGH